MSSRRLSVAVESAALVAEQWPSSKGRRASGRRGKMGAKVMSRWCWPKLAVLAPCRKLQHGSLFLSADFVAVQEHKLQGDAKGTAERRLIAAGWDCQLDEPYFKVSNIGGGTGIGTLVGRSPRGLANLRPWIRPEGVAGEVSGRRHRLIWWGNPRLVLRYIWPTAAEAAPVVVGSREGGHFAGTAFHFVR